MTSMTASQLRHWFGHLLAPAAPVGNLPVLLELIGQLEASRLAAALDSLPRRWPALARRYAARADGAPYSQPVDGAVPLTVVDLTDVADPDQRRSRSRQAVAAHAATRLDLPGTGPTSARLIRTGRDEHLLSLVLHRIAIDELDIPALIGELAAAYTTRPDGAGPGEQVGGTAGPVGPDPWAVLDEAERARRLGYWVERTAGVSPLDLPADRPRPAVPAYRADRFARRLPASVAGRLRELAGGELAPAVAAGFAAVLARYCGQTDLVLGVPVPTGSRVTGTGPIDPLPLRLDLSSEAGYSGIGIDGLIRRCRDAWADAAAHHAPLAAVLAHRGEARTWDRHPLFQVTVTPLVDSPANWPAGLSVRRHQLAPAALAVDLDLAVTDGSAGAELALSYLTDLFDRPRMVRLLDHLLRLLTGAAADPTRTVAELPLLSESEQEPLQRTWQGPILPYETEPVHRQIQRWAETDPARVAVRLGDRTLSYGELDRRATALARFLRSQGVRPEEIVAVALDRGIEVFVALVGVLKAGAAFVMMDPTHPPNRLRFILSDTGARFLLTRQELAPGLPAAEAFQTVCLDTDWSRIAAADQDTAPLVEAAHHDSLAYVLYTSGSTGQPKGVLIEHGPLSNFLRWLSWLFHLGPGDRMLQHMALVFDFAQGEIFTCLTSGATMVLIPEQSRTSPAEIGRLIAEERLTYVGGPPAVLGRVPQADYPDLRYVLVGGEAFPGELVNHWNRPGRRFVNGYGPTEAAVGCIYYECQHRPWTTQPPIGRAMPNRYAYIVDRWDQLAPVGVPGEILVGGAGLARGYLNCPELTSQRFIPDPFRRHGRVYRTGDLGVWTEDGQIQFLGRIDSQVKVNGLRVELEEIESVLATHPAVDQAAVTLGQDATGAGRLTGHVVAEPGCPPPTAEELRRHLAVELPRYLVPGRFLVQDTIPLTTVGKVDRRALAAEPDQGGAAAGFRPPRTPAESLVAGAFEEVLGAGPVGLDDDFFALGGDSLGALRLLARIRGALGAAPPLASFCAEPTVAAVTANCQPTPADATTADVAEDELRRLLDQVESLDDRELERLLQATTHAPHPPIKE